MRRWSRPEKEVHEQVGPLNEAERDWVAQHVATARALLRESGLQKDGELSAESLDELWVLLGSQSPEDVNTAINVVGLAFGQLMVDRFDLGWVALTDEHGTEVAVRGPSNFTVFPTNFVAKRYERGETGFLVPFFEEISHTLDRLT
jgi:Domain of unknown function (DUF3806)